MGLQAAAIGVRGARAARPARRGLLVSVRGAAGRRALLTLGDLAIVLLSFDLAVTVRMGGGPGRIFSARWLPLVACLATAYLASFSVFDLYNLRVKIRGSRFLAAMGAAFGLAYLFAIVCFYIFPYRLGRGVFLISWALTGALIFGWRLGYAALFNGPDARRNVLILGNGSMAGAMKDALRGDPEFKLAAVLDAWQVKLRLETERSAGGAGTIEDFIAQNRIDDVVVSLSSGIPADLERALVDCRMKGIPCYTVEAFYERLFEKLPVPLLSDRWFLASSGFERLGSGFYKLVKRGIDFSAASLILLLTLPVSALIALLIPLTSKGPVFFVQERLGGGKVPFRIFKFRTMVDGAEADGPRWAEANDRRVTGLGRILRRTRLDEIPQLLNVFKGEMSLIGPRPERGFFVDRLTERIPFYGLRFFVKPGITGWAQVKFRYGADEEDALEKLRYDLFYIKNQSLLLDVRILVNTIRVVLTGAGR